MALCALAQMSSLCAQTDGCESLMTLGGSAVDAGLIHEGYAQYRSASSCYESQQDRKGVIDASFHALDCLSRLSELIQMEDESAVLQRYIKAHRHELDDGYLDSIASATGLFEVLRLLATGDPNGAITLLDSLIPVFTELERRHRNAFFEKRTIHAMTLKADAYASAGDFGQAIVDYRRAIDNSKQHGTDWIVDGAIIEPHLKIAACYQSLGKTPQVIAEYQEVRTLLALATSKQDEREFHVYSTIFDFYLDQHPDSAAVYLKLLQKKRAAPFQTEILIRSGKYLLKAEQPKKAKLELQRARDLASRMQGTRSAQLAQIDLLIGKCSLELQDYPSGLAHLHDALLSLTSVDESIPVLSNPTSDKLFRQRDLLEVLQLKSSALYAMYQTGKGEEYLSSAWETSMLAVRQLNELREVIHGAQDRALIIDYSYPVFAHALRLSHHYFEQSKEDKWIDTAMVLMEQSKALNLLDAVRHEQARRSAGIPDSLITRERQLRQEIVAKAEHLRTYRRASNRNLAAEARFAEALQSAETQYGALLRAIEQDYSHYFEQIRKAEMTATETQRLLGKDQALIEYFVTDTELYSIHLTAERRHFNDRKLASPLGPRIRHLNTLGLDFIRRKSKESSHDYISASYALYQALVQDISLEKTSVIIIPDGVLGYLSFAGLISDTTGVGLNFAEITYVLNNHDVSYIYSAKLLDELLGRPDEALEGALSCAPTFSSAPQLLLSESEATMVYRLFGGSLLVGESCTADTVKNELSQSTPQILHLATHGVANTGNGAESYVLFAGDSTDSYLFARDLYALPIHAGLVYLAACESGTGELQKGEGVVSLARAFFHAGARSLVTALWPLEDARSSKITSAFYKRLKKGSPTSQAMADAQRAYLAQLPADEYLYAHPVYWSALVSIGDPGIIFSPARFPKWLIIALLGTLTLFGVFLFRKK